MPTHEPTWLRLRQVMGYQANQGGDAVVRSERLVRWFVPIVAGLVVLAGLWPVGNHHPEAQAAGCWQAEIAEQQTDVDLVGSVLRVSVQGKVGLPVTVRSMGAFETVGFTGTKPEYGPFVAEFAPLSKGTYFIEPQGMGLVFEVWLDGKNYTRVNFTPQSCAPTTTPTRPPVTATRRATGTATLSPAPTQTPKPSGWQGRVVEHRTDLEGRYYATIAVRIIGRPAGQEVEIRADPWSETCKTGTKPEHGPDACEFGALNAGTYRLSPRDLGVHLDVTVDLKDFVLVEFTYTGPTPQTAWVGSVVENTSGGEPTEYVNSAIAVIVAGKPWHEAEIRAGDFSATCLTGTKPEYGPDACEFGGLRAGTYTLTPKDLGASIPVTVDGWGWAKVRFEQVAAPTPLPTATPTPPGQPTPTPTVLLPGQPTATPTAQSSPTPPKTGWQGWIISNTSGQSGGTGVWSIIVVRVINYGGVPVHITGGGNWSDTCITGTKPEFGPDACSFGGLWAGTYTLRPEGSDFEIEIEMDGIGTAEVHFAAP